VAVDRPFSGAIVPLAHHRKTPAVRSLMIEVNRALYMDETSGQRLVGMPRFQETLQRVLRGLIDRCSRIVA
jgi:N-formylglutamate deformylase